MISNNDVDCLFGSQSMMNFRGDFLLKTTNCNLVSMSRDDNLNGCCWFGNVCFCSIYIINFKSNKNGDDDDVPRCLIGFLKAGQVTVVKIIIFLQKHTQKHQLVLELQEDIYMITLVEQNKHRLRVCCIQFPWCPWLWLISNSYEKHVVFEFNPASPLRQAEDGASNLSGNGNNNKQQQQQLVHRIELMTTIQPLVRWLWWQAGQFQSQAAR